jgi:hypothetical protein
MSNLGQVRVKTRGCEVELDYASLYSIANRNVWLPHSQIHDYGTYIIMPRWLAIRNGLPFKPLYNTPPKIEPRHNQKALKELEYKGEQNDRDS